MGNIGPEIELEWLIHYKCNYRCPYCFFEGMWDEVQGRNVYRSTGQWLDAWERIHKRYGHLRLLITGGEPFLYPDFVKLAGELSRDFSIGFDTNLSCSEELLAEFARKAFRENTSLGLSFHPRFAVFEPFLKKALFLKNKGFRVCVQYVSYPEQINQMNSYRLKFEDNGLYFIPLPFRGRYNGKLYPAAHSEEEKQMIYNSMENLQGEHQNRVEKQLCQVKTRGRSCRAGQVYARVDNDGSVYRCGRYVSSNHSSLGSIFDEGFRFLDAPLPCEEEICPCEFRWLAE